MEQSEETWISIHKSPVIIQAISGQDTYWSFEATDFSIRLRPSFALKLSLESNLHKRFKTTGTYQDFLEFKENGFPDLKSLEFNHHRIYKSIVGFWKSSLAHPTQWPLYIQLEREHKFIVTPILNGEAVKLHQFKPNIAEKER